MMRVGQRWGLVGNSLRKDPDKFLIFEILGTVESEWQITLVIARDYARTFGPVLNECRSH